MIGSFKFLFRYLKKEPSFPLGTYLPVSSLSFYFVFLFRVFSRIGFESFWGGERAGFPNGKWGSLLLVSFDSIFLPRSVIG